MKKLFILFAVVTAVVSCSKEADEPSNTINVSASMQTYLQTSGSGSTMYYQPFVTVDKTMTDSAFFVVQWDHYNAANVYAFQLRDTVKLPPSMGSNSHISTYLVAGGQAKNVKLINAWSKSGTYTFNY